MESRYVTLLGADGQLAKFGHSGVASSIELAWSAQLAAGLQQSQHLSGLAHAHIVCQTSAEGELAQKMHPSETFALIGSAANLAVQGGVCCCSMYWRMTAMGAPPHLPAKYLGDQSAPAQSFFRMLGYFF